MIDRNAEGDAAAALLERRWFASITAVRTLQAECDILREVMEQAEAAWRRARTELVRLEELRDALGDELALCEAHQEAPVISVERAVSSAA